MLARFEDVGADNRRDPLGPKSAADLRDLGTRRSRAGR
jgi:hypothetical protein